LGLDALPFDTGLALFALHTHTERVATGSCCTLSVKFAELVFAATKVLNTLPFDTTFTGCTFDLSTGIDFTDAVDTTLSLFAQRTDLDALAIEGTTDFIVGTIGLFAFVIDTVTINTQTSLRASCLITIRWSTFFLNAHTFTRTIFVIFAGKRADTLAIVTGLP
jgi:hypothetical protein